MNRKYSKEDVEKFLGTAKARIEKIKNSNIQDLIKNMIEPYSRRLDEISELCEVNKFKMYFIGDVGVGKSTAISHVSGLISLDKLKEKDENILIDDLVLLKSASGRTTLCETVIKYSKNEETSIIIEKMEEEEFNKFVEDFCNQIVDKQSDNILSQEIFRVIKNMSEFPTQLSKKEKDKIKQSNGERKKEELRLLNEKQLVYVKKILEDNEDVYDEQVYKKKLNNAILKMIGYKSRENTIFIQNKSEKIFDWLKKTYEDINYGKIKECPYPKKIIITLNKSDINTIFPSYISEIIDTKGLDGIGVRDDIQKIIKSKDSIVIFCNNISEFGSIFNRDWIVSSLKSSSNINYRSFILGLERGIQLENTNDSSGDRLEGMEQKKEELINQHGKAFKETKFFEDNIQFYNALRGINYNSSNRIIDFDSEKYQEERIYLINLIDKSIENMYDELNIEIKKITSQLKILEDNRIDEDLNYKLNKCKKEILDYIKEIETNKTTSISKLSGRITQIHASSVRGSVNRNGKHVNCNVYSECSQIGNDDFNSDCSKKKYAFEKFLQKEDLFRYDSEIENVVKEAIIYITNQLYKDFEAKMSEAYKLITEENIYESKFWDQVKLYWGDGRGRYRDRVIEEIIKEIRNTNTIIEIQILEYS